MDWHAITMMTGAALVGASGLKSLAALVAGRRAARLRRLHYFQTRANFQQRLAGELQWARAAKPLFKSWSNERPFRVAAVVDEAVGYKSFYLVPVDGRALPRFEPGQYVTFHLPVDPQRKPLVRCYSLSQRPREDYYRITVKLMESPAGLGSGYLHRQVKVGSVLGVQAPQGNFFLDPRDELPVVLIAAGVGVAPLWSMLATVVHQRSARTVHLFAGFRNSQEHPFREQMAELTTHENIHCDVSYSRPLPKDRLGTDFDHQGHVTILRLRQRLPSNNYRFYVCGPPGMMEQIVPDLVHWGVPKKHIHFEAFGPATVRSLQEPSQGVAEPCWVKFAKAERELEWDGRAPSLLDFAESAAMCLDSGCRAGSCGACVVKVLSGNIAHSKSPGVPLAGDECLMCIGTPRGDVVLDV